MNNKPAPKAPAKKSAPGAPTRKPASKASADAKAFHDIRTIYSRFAKVYGRVPVLRIDGHSLPRTYLGELGILASLALLGMGLPINPKYAGVDLLVGVNYLDRSATTILAGGSGE